MENKTVTTLDVVSGAFGWQGGTIHQAKEEFLKSSMGVKDRVCNALMRAIDAKSLQDVETASFFFKARIN